MKNKIIFIFLLLISFSGFTQNLTEREFVILTFEMNRNKDSHGTFIYYWITELEKYENANEYKDPKLNSLFLQELGSSDALESCCLGKTSDPFTYTTSSEFDFPENHSEYLSELRELIKKNRQKIQVIKKEWKKGYKEKVTVYATAVSGEMCECEFGGKKYLKRDSRLNFPKGNYEILKDYLTKDKQILLFKDFSNFDFINTASRTSK